MAKLTAPVLSFGARGTIAKTVTFSSWRGVKYGRERVIPANPQSTEQTITRTVFAALREMWKVAPSILTEPWYAFAEGRPFTGMNAYVGENLRVIRGDALFSDWIGSPGAKGGLAAPSIAFAPGAAGIIAVTATAPTLPTGWTIVEAQAAAFPDQDPEDDFVGPIIANSDATDPYTFNLTGLPTATSCIAAGWFKFMKPNGDFAYSVGVTDTVMSG